MITHKTRIVIADNDFNYIVPLQLKFVEDFFDKIDLEIISDEEYYNSFFSSPQNIDILIISEDLFSPSLQKHNIENIFVMTEQYEEDETAELNVYRIFKYTSIKEIFNEIIGKSVSVLHLETEIQKEPQIVLVYSAAGGVGKTTVSLGVCGCLTKNYKRVLYISAERLQTFQYRLQNSSPITDPSAYAELINASEDIYSNIKHTIRKEIFSYVPPFKAVLMSLGVDYSVFAKIAESAKKSYEYDYIVVDTDSVLDNDKAELIAKADKVIVVTGQDSSSVSATNLFVSNINGTNSDKYFFICNNFSKNNDNSLISPKFSAKFSVSDYVEHIYHYDTVTCEDLAKNPDIQKIAFLVM